ncbi:CoA-disulfide reductase, partial [Vibrio parahaemolyticus]|nr:CoA-disulfide reductase [Vibrio parahaemolyticus]
TSDPSIYAVGDAVEEKDFVTGEQTLVPLAGPANRQGRIAADNMLGRQETYQGTQGTAICKIFDLAVASTGKNEKQLKRENIAYEKVYVHTASHASYYPGAETVSFKMLFDPVTGKILGAQAVGKDGVDKRIDVMAVAQRAGMTVEQLQHLELTYAPPYGSAKDVINQAAFVANNIIKGDA